LIQGLVSGTVAPPYRLMSLQSVLRAADHAASVADCLQIADEKGLSAEAIALALRCSEREAAKVVSPDMVWSGPEVKGLHARDTRAVYEELLGSATRSLWLSSYTFYKGKQAFKSLAARMDEIPELEVSLLLNIQRQKNDQRSAVELIAEYAERYWGAEWPGERKPAIYFDPRSVQPAPSSGILHAKAVVADDEQALVTSANLTEAAFDRNIEIGLLVKDPTLAATISKHFRRLIEIGDLQRLPSA
jgi:phosphatidylserine/phosphatidylglycerophosphate/cardiolipin synthase-like enzyme